MNSVLSEPKLIPSTSQNPIHLLQNEHALLLGQLALLEQQGMRREDTAMALKTLIRDSGVHFKREGFLLRDLEKKLGVMRRALQPLMGEHRDFRQQAMDLLKKCQTPESSTQDHECLVLQIRDFAKRLREHINHEETVVYVLAKSRLTTEEQNDIAHRMLVV